MQYACIYTVMMQINELEIPDPFFMFGYSARKKYYRSLENIWKDIKQADA